MVLGLADGDVAIPRRGNEDPTVTVQVRGRKWGLLMLVFAAIRRLCATRLWFAATVGVSRRSEDVVGLAVEGAPAVAFGLGAGREGVDQDSVVARVDLGFHGRVEPFHLSGAEVALEDAALDVVQVLAAGLEHAGVAFGGGVVHDDDVHGSPPDPERLVGHTFQARAGEPEGFEVDQFVVGDGSL